MNKVIFYAKSLIDFILFYCSKLIPKKQNRWVFGSWFGDKFADNSKWLYIYTLKNISDVEVIWITKSEENYKIIRDLGGKVYLYNSFKALYYIITAKVAFMTQSFRDLASYNLIGGALKVQLWHGIALKKIGFDSYGNNEGKNILKKVNSKLVNFLRTYDLYIAPSSIYKEVIKTAFRVNENKILDVGQPRNDIFFHNELKCQFRNQINESIQKNYGININEKKIITYMPTFRDNKNLSFSFMKLTEKQQQEINKVLENNNSVIIEKAHFVDINIRQKNINNALKNIIPLNDVD
ncbi:MAG: CDP-glycerol glycerophosphotransferase family protein, partial [Clostridiaceae bacterium]